MTSISTFGSLTDSNTFSSLTNDPALLPSQSGTPDQLTIAIDSTHQSSALPGALPSPVPPPASPIPPSPVKPPRELRIDTGEGNLSHAQIIHLGDGKLNVNHTNRVSLKALNALPHLSPSALGSNSLVASSSSTHQANPTSIPANHAQPTATANQGNVVGTRPSAFYRSQLCKQIAVIMLIVGIIFAGVVVIVAMKT